jgi:hypothetical protein
VLRIRVRQVLVDYDELAPDGCRVLTAGDVTATGARGTANTDHDIGMRC